MVLGAENWLDYNVFENVADAQRQHSLDSTLKFFSEPLCA